MHAQSIGILGLGAYLPEKVLTNFDLEKIVDTTDEWIRTRTGIHERRVSEKGIATSDLASKASLEALQNANLKPEDLDLIICATITPDTLFPSTACYIQNKIGAKCPGFDISAACSGFPYALTIANGLVKSGMYKKILVIGAEVLSNFINWKDRSTCVLFGDGAGAAIIGEVNNGHGIIATYLGADGAQTEILKIPGGGSAIPLTVETLEAGKQYVYMEGKEVFKLAVRSMCDAIEKVVELGGLRIEDIDCLIPHQANIRILDAVTDRAGIPSEKVFINVNRYGNMSAASTPVALYEAVKQGMIKKGSNVVLVAFGSGLTWAACLIKW
ncbi:MAG: 3-oxoacyl-ACP synthase [Omnitrophica bacterium RIFCSPLOWO2_12_FULL_44_17]|uniref:Beta-ketoacyl-[acyl-carrier-protein] synthase III n=1 Tax=Candidatus Danuiimicrobium aquiferis TaxID=1801832 RepID=A0A1G1KYJ9_9BACT|nr:MAG: 3-oxoacyl-ACP synthase [Omnitrophica bacterium RIFCSPHIGHO2_02_FULL_45_28]OGW90239.1 MAG: 3-oxoacyl-ACP synthase [Omnitrophica bacterium RIFCSPHIGHO2_12_FULL_44_12]OGW97974.1 MAG: 3-oxoacyl-ACP synthase [Omnitrophica bacterium RIFCSPLOWO2_12_FULL_44_17]OGX02528.1 MAG: 3-oxoacyl-ACP synthase [Omnitrophica bacterium RIFCSPLOWO2_02_FULL_44_11]